MFLPGASRLGAQDAIDQDVALQDGIESGGDDGERVGFAARIMGVEPFASGGVGFGKTGKQRIQGCVAYGQKGFAGAIQELIVIQVLYGVAAGRAG